MDIEKKYSSLVELYSKYNKTVKYLIADIETRYQAFPLPVLNEIRSFNDHISRYILETTPYTTPDEEYKKADSHLKRILLDCFKYLNIYFYDYVKKFEKSTRYVDLTTINNGEFYPKLSKYKIDAKKTVKEAKRLETLNHEEALKKYEEAYNIYCEVEKFIEENHSNILWARVRFTTKWFINIIIFIISSIIAGLTGYYLREIFPNSELYNSLRAFFI